MKRRQWIWALLIVGVVAAVWYSYVTVRGPKLTGGELVMRPECGGHDSVLVDPNFTATDGIPEYNDCQRFVVGPSGARQYDSLYAIFVSSVAPTIAERLGPPLPAVTRVPGAGVSIVPVPPISAPIAATLAPANATAITIAMVDAGGNYPTLGIVAGRNCLYIWNYTAQGTIQWTAKMTVAVNDLCPQRSVGELEPLPGKVLQVYREQVVDPETNQKFGSADYPDVARWDWDLKNGKQYVSIVCEVAWCEIGEQGFERSPPLPLDGTNSVGERRVRLIKGWNDQQYLAKRETNGQLTPSVLLGTIFPVPDLGTLDSPSNFSGWTNVAYIVAEVPEPAGDDVLDQYETKLGFRKSTFRKPLRVQMKNLLGNWRARVGHQWIGPIWANKENKVKFRPTGAGGFKVPGTARWRWKDIDEGTWTRCTAGCCEMSD